MSGSIYDETHVVLNRLVGRVHNNPLGEDAFPLLARIIHHGPAATAATGPSTALWGPPAFCHVGYSYAQSAVHPTPCSRTGFHALATARHELSELARLGGNRHPLQVLDAGSGRGASARWWASRGHQVTALEPSDAMRRESAALAKEHGLDALIDHVAGDLSILTPEPRFDLVMLHDVLCYLPEPTVALGRVLSAVKPGGIASVTDYHGNVDVPAVAALVDAWAIRSPWTFKMFRAGLDAIPARVLLHVDTTRQYRDHWKGIGRSLEASRVEAIAAVGVEAVGRFETQVKAIEAAVATGEFGHHWAVLEVAE